MFEWTYLLYLALFAGAIGLGTGLIDLSFLTGETEEDEDYTDTAQTAPGYDASAYAKAISGSDGDDTITAKDGQSSLAYMLEAGSDVLIATGGDDYAYGGAGDDTLVLRDGDDIAYGGNGADALRGGAGDDTIAGGYGDDAIFGGIGDDTLSGDGFTNPADMARGSDVIDGGAGDDNIFLGDGDIATGGTGADTFAVFDLADPDQAAAHVTDFETETDALEVHYVEETDPDTGDPILPVVSVTYDGDADVTSVFLDGHAVATLDGEQAIAAEDITLSALV